METTLVTRMLERDGRQLRALRVCSVEVVGGPSAGARARIDRPLFRVGSHAQNDLVLADDTVSKHHLEVSVEPFGYRVVDLSSSNGTFAGELRLGEVTITSPLELRLGASRLLITPEETEVQLQGSARTRFGRLLGASAVMRELFDALERIAPSDCSVLLEGETGVGKEAVAESLHQESPRAAGPFVVVDCGALVGELIEAELFGHVRGAFSGAEREREGLLTMASGGTVFLDEIAELPLTAQAKLLGALERRRVTPLGSSRPRPIDLRVVAATHRNLAREVNQGRFRPDLYYRLAVVRVRVPPLRERTDDIPLLVGALLAELRARTGKDLPLEASAASVARLSAQPWPGNVRELRNAIERLVLKLPDEGGPRELPAPPMAPFQAAREEARAQFEQRYFTELLSEPGLTLAEAARRSQLDRGYLHRILRRLGLSTGEGGPR